jgi:hypothetical protein
VGEAYQQSNQKQPHRIPPQEDDMLLSDSPLATRTAGTSPGYITSVSP